MGFVTAAQRAAATAQRQQQVQANPTGSGISAAEEADYWAANKASKPFRFSTPTPEVSAPAPVMAPEATPPEPAAAIATAATAVPVSGPEPGAAPAEAIRVSGGGGSASGDPLGAARGVAGGVWLSNMAPGGARQSLASLRNRVY